MKFVRKGGVSLAHGANSARSRAAAAASGEMDEKFQSSGEYDSMATATIAVARGGDGEMNGATSTL
jgi:hypothetical protein